MGKKLLWCSYGTCGLVMEAGVRSFTDGAELIYELPRAKAPWQFIKKIAFCRTPMEPTFRTARLCA